MKRNTAALCCLLLVVFVFALSADTRSDRSGQTQAQPLEIRLNYALAGNDRVVLRAAVRGGVAPYQILWSLAPSGDHGGPTPLNPAFFLGTLEPGENVFVALVTDASGEVRTAALPIAHRPSR